MKNAEQWRPSKIVYDPARRAHVANPDYVGLGTLLTVDRIADPYERVLRRHAKGRLLDCGCGDVPYYGIYRELVSDVVCVDWAVSQHGRIHVDVEINLDEPLPFEATRFDTVLLADVLEHVSKPWQLMREIGRVLSPGGKAIVMVPFLYAVHERPHDYFRYTEFALRKLFDGASLHAIEVEPYGGLPDVLMDLTNKVLAPTETLCKAFVAGARRITDTRAVERWRSKTKQAFPLGYCAVAVKG